MSSNGTPAPRWRGINHLAMVTDDMDETVRFYAGVLGMPLVATVGNASFRHYFFDLGPGSTIAFFEYRHHAVDAFASPAGVPDPRKIQFDHVSFDVPDEEALLELRRRLKEHDVEVTDVVDHDFIRSIYFHDNNGIALEASWWTREAPTLDTPPDPAAFRDPEPVPAAIELTERGHLARPAGPTRMA